MRRIVFGTSYLAFVRPLAKVEKLNGLRYGPYWKNMELLRKIGTVIGDNSGTNDTLCRTISAYLASEIGKDWSPTLQRIRCQGHILNLVVQAFFLSNRGRRESTMESYDQSEVQREEELDEKQKKRAGTLHAK
jgi:hypothetical protein